MKLIYCAISVEQELPKIHGWYGILDKQGQVIQAHWGLEEWRYTDGKLLNINITHWLKPITSLSELPEDWKAEIREIAGNAFDAGEKHAGFRSFRPNKQEHLKGIL